MNRAVWSMAGVLALAALSGTPVLAQGQDHRAPGLDLPAAPATASPRVIHDTAIVTDMHVDSLWQMHQRGYDFGRPDSRAQVDPKRLRRGGVDAQFFAVWMPPDSPGAFKLANDMIDLFETGILAERPCIRLAKSSRDVIELERLGCIAALLGIEGAAPLEGRPENMRHFARRGVRYMSLTWNESNRFADGAKAAHPRGITSKGRRLVRLLNELSVMVDVSHASRETFWDVITESRRPVIASHSNANSIFAHARNLDDAQLWAIRESRGVAGLNFHGGFLHKRSRKASIGDVVQQAQHMIAVAGIDSVGMGTDFDGNIRAPRGLKDISYLPALTGALKDQGFGSTELMKLLGHNTLRVLHETETGPLRHRVRHRPIPMSPEDVSATSGDRTARLAVDHDATTAWRFEPRRLPAQLTLHAGNGKLGRVSVCASTTSTTSGVRQVHVVVTGAGVSTFEAVLPMGTGVVPVSVEVPPAFQRSPDVTVQIEVRSGDYLPQAGEPVLAEVLVEACVKDCGAR